MKGGREERREEGPPPKGRREPDLGKEGRAEEGRKVKGIRQNYNNSVQGCTCITHQEEKSGSDYHRS